MYLFRTNLFVSSIFVAPPSFTKSTCLYPQLKLFKRICPLFHTLSSRVFSYHVCIPCTLYTVFLRGPESCFSTVSWYIRIFANILLHLLVLMSDSQRPIGDRLQTLSLRAYTYFLYFCLFYFSSSFIFTKYKFNKNTIFLDKLKLLLLLFLNE